MCASGGASQGGRASAGPSARCILQGQEGSSWQSVQAEGRRGEDEPAEASQPGVRSGTWVSMFQAKSPQHLERRGQYGLTQGLNVHN